MRLIDADALKYRRGEYSGYDDVEIEERKRGILYLLKEDITSAPTIDAMPIVRCKDCKYGPVYDGIYRTHGECEFGDNGDDFFCPYGKRREDG